MIYASPSTGSVERITADDSQTGYCPSCQALLIPKRGPIVIHHWSHRADECDPWSEPESEWHRAWKMRALHQGDRVEVVMGEHRADIVRDNGTIVELQATYLSAEQIMRREDFYGSRLVWLYRAEDWIDRLWAKQNSPIWWWKHGAKSLLAHRQPIYWDTGTPYGASYTVVKRVRIWPFQVNGRTRIYGQTLRHWHIENPVLVESA